MTHELLRSPSKLFLFPSFVKFVHDVKLLTRSFCPPQNFHVTTTEFFGGFLGEEVNQQTYSSSTPTDLLKFDSNRPAQVRLQQTYSSSTPTDLLKFDSNRPTQVQLQQTYSTSTPTYMTSNLSNKSNHLSRIAECPKRFSSCQGFFSFVFGLLGWFFFLTSFSLLFMHNQRPR